MKRDLYLRILLPRSDPVGHPDDAEMLVSGMTTTGINFVEHDEHVKLLPCITIFPFQAFRTKGFYFTSQSYNQVSVI